MLLFFNINVLAMDVKLSKCIDGDTAKFNINGKVYSVRFLAIDSPEMDTDAGKRAAEFTCNRLKNANKIIIEYDDNSDKYDKYDRQLAWIFVDDKLLQKDIIDNGYAKVAYLYGDYKYTHLLEEKEIENDYLSYLLLFGFIISFILIIKTRKIMKCTL